MVQVATHQLLISVAVPVPGARRPRREAVRMPEAQIEAASHRVRDALPRSCAHALSSVQAIRSRLGHHRPKPRYLSVGMGERGTKMPALRLRRVEADALQATLTSGVPHTIRSLAAGRDMVAGTQVRVQEVHGVKMEQLVTGKGLEIVGPTAKAIRVDAGNHLHRRLLCL